MTVIIPAKLYSRDERRELVLPYLEQAFGSKAEFLQDRQIAQHRMYRWRKALADGDLDSGQAPRKTGRLCLMEKRTKAVYSFEIKKEVVDRHAAGETMMDLAKEFNLSSLSLARTWAKQHSEGGDEALMLKPKGRPEGSEKPVALSEEDKLRRELKRVQAENAYLKKLRDLRNQGHA